MKFVKKILVFILILESRLVLRKYKPFVIAVTGSVGKTSTKDAIYDVIKSKSSYVRKSQKSLNSEIGLPLTIIGVPNAWYSLSGWIKNINAGLKLIFTRQEYPDTLVIEVGADHPGDIKKVAPWLSPNIAVITRVSSTPVHVEFFGSPEEVLEEKSSLALNVKNGGTAILYGDGDNLNSLAEELFKKGIKVIRFGTKETLEVCTNNYATTYEDGPSGFCFDLSIDSVSVPVSMNGIIGNTYMYPLGAAASVGKVKGMQVGEIAKLLPNYEAPNGRMNIISGLNGSTLIDDTYNSSPDATVAALESLKSLECSGNRIAILGDMMELGKYSAEQHRLVGKKAAECVSKLVVVGPRSRATLESAVESGMSPESVWKYDNAKEAVAEIVKIIGPHDIVLIKGSQSVRMERVTEALMRDPREAKDLLVRQDKEWLDKA